MKNLAENKKFLSLIVICLMTVWIIWMIEGFVNLLKECAGNYKFEISAVLFLAVIIDDWRNKKIENVKKINYFNTIPFSALAILILATIGSFLNHIFYGILVLIIDILLAYSFMENYKDLYFSIKITKENED